MSQSLLQGSSAFPVVRLAGQGEAASALSALESVPFYAFEHSAGEGFRGAYWAEGATLLCGPVQLEELSLERLATQTVQVWGVMGIPLAGCVITVAPIVGGWSRFPWARAASWRRGGLNSSTDDEQSWLRGWNEREQFGSPRPQSATKLFTTGEYVTVEAGAPARVLPAEQVEESADLLRSLLNRHVEDDDSATDGNVEVAANLDDFLAAGPQRLIAAHRVLEAEEGVPRPALWSLIGAVGAASTLDRTARREWLEQALIHSRPSIRDAAADALVELGDDLAREALRSAAAREPVEVVRRNLLSAIRDLGG